MRKRRKNNLEQKIIVTIVLMLIITIGYFLNPTIKKYIDDSYSEDVNKTQNIPSYDLASIPEYSGTPYVIINNNIPNFTEEDYTTQSFERYSELDSLGRCGVAYANICREIMPSDGDERGDISSVKPTGWKQKKYNGEYLYNRCHLIGYQLSDEDANELNLITGTRYFNVSGMLDFENQVASYIKGQDKNENKHVLYRVTPYFDGNNLVANRSSNGSIFC